MTTADVDSRLAEADLYNVPAELHEHLGLIPEQRGPMTAQTIRLAAERARRAAVGEAQRTRLKAARETTLALERARGQQSVPSTPLPEPQHALVPRCV